MKSLILFITTTFLCLTILNGQPEPELIADFLPGHLPGFFKDDENGIKLGDTFIMEANNGIHGLELVAIKDQQVSLIKDIRVGFENSRIKSFIELNGLVYFSAYDDTNGGAIWVTDGTEEGTRLFYDPHPTINYSPGGLIKSESGHIYFTLTISVSDHLGNLYRIDGTETGSTLIAEDVYFHRNYCGFEEGVAFLRLNEEGTIELFKATDSLTKLAELPNAASAEFFGTRKVKEGILFNIYDADDNNMNGTWLYKESTGEFERFEVAPGLGIPSRTIKYNEDEIILLYEDEDVIYVVNGNTSDTKKILDSSWYGGSFSKFPYVITEEGHFVFVSGTYSNPILYRYDGTEIVEQHSLDYSNPSNLLSKSGLVYIVDGAWNANYTQFYTLDNNNSLKNIANIDGIYNKWLELLYIDDNGYLIFIADVEDQYGTELYKLKLENAVSNNNINNSLDFESILNNEGAVLNSSLDKSIELYVYDLLGRNVSHQKARTNQFIPIDYVHGLNVLVFKIGDQSFTKKYLFME